LAEGRQHNPQSGQHSDLKQRALHTTAAATKLQVFVVRGRQNRNKMADKQLRNRVVELDEFESGQSCSVVMQNAQIELFEDTTSDFVVEAAVGRKRTIVGVESSIQKVARPETQPNAVGAESRNMRSQTADSYDSLGDFIASAFLNMSESQNKLSEKIESDNTKLRGDIGKEYEKLMQKFEAENQILN
jgi:hypothetical protein